MLSSAHPECDATQRTHIYPATHKLHLHTASRFGVRRTCSAVKPERWWLVITGRYMMVDEMEVSAPNVACAGICIYITDAADTYSVFMERRQRADWCSSTWNQAETAAEAVSCVAVSAWWGTTALKWRSVWHRWWRSDLAQGCLCQCPVKNMGRI